MSACMLPTTHLLLPDQEVPPHLQDSPWPHPCQLRFFLNDPLVNCCWHILQECFLILGLHISTLHLPNARNRIINSQVLNDGSNHHSSPPCSTGTMDKAVSSL